MQRSPLAKTVHYATNALLVLNVLLACMCRCNVLSEGGLEYIHLNTSSVTHVAQHESQAQLHESRKALEKIQLERRVTERK